MQEVKKDFDFALIKSARAYSRVFNNTTGNAGKIGGINSPRAPTTPQFILRLRKW